MKVSIALHTGEPDPYGNQRALEAAYQNYNRQYAELEIDHDTGNGIAQFNVEFPTAGEPYAAYFFSIGTCIAPADLGGQIILYGPINPALCGHAGSKPGLNAAALVERQRLVAMQLIQFTDSRGWTEKTADELRDVYPKAA